MLTYTYNIYRHVDHTLLVDPLCKAITQGNSRNQVPLISKLLEILPKVK